MGRLFLIVCVLSVFIFLANDTVFPALPTPILEPKHTPYLIADVQYQILKNHTNVVIGTNERLEFVYYTFENPYRIVIDLMGVVFCDLEQKINIEEGPLKSITIVEDNSVPRPQGLDKYFYAVDYIVVELREKLPSQTFSSKDGKIIVAQINTHIPQEITEEAKAVTSEEVSSTPQKETPAKLVIIEEVEYEVTPEGSNIFLASDKELNAVIYEQYNPYQIIIKPSIPTFCELEEKMEPMDGLVKSISVTKDVSQEYVKLPNEFLYPVKEIVIEPIVQLPFSASKIDNGKITIVKIEKDIKIAQAQPEEPLSQAAKEEEKPEIKKAPEEIKPNPAEAEPVSQLTPDEKQKMVDEITQKLYQKQEELFAKREQDEERKRFIREARDKAKAIRSIEKIGIEELQDLMVKGEGTATLKYCQDIASSYSETAAVAEEEVKLSKMKVKENFRALFPSVKLKGTYTSGATVGVDFIEKLYGVEAEHPLYQGGRVWNAYRQSKVNLDLANAKYDKVTHDLNYKVAEAYYGVVTAAMNIKLQKEVLKKAEGILKTAQTRRASGFSTDLELFNVTSQYNQVQFQLASAERDLALSRFKLEQAMGLDIAAEDIKMGEVETDLKFEIIDIDLNKCLELAQEYHPDIIVNELLVISNEYEEKIARGKDRLKIDLTGFYGRSGSHYITEPDKMNPDWNIGIKASKPFGGNTASYSFTKEETKKKVGQTDRQGTQTQSGEFSILDAMGIASGIQEAQIKRHKAENDLLEARRGINLDVKEAYYNYQEAIIQVKNSLEKVRYQKEALKTAVAQAQLNEALQSQVLDSHIKLADERSLYIKALSDYNFALAKLNKAVGIDDFFSIKKEQPINKEQTSRLKEGKG